ncbi:MAG: lipopolysaccharide heptosyltransferase II [Candidatus Omnitrophica bacterium]|nr:lipopolysaccharide heptosyltransferase II [Candidatus Omnitrophota bacterium]
MEIKKILIFNPFGIGDVLFSMPLVRNLKENLPNAAMHYLCNQRVFPLLKNYPSLDKVFIFEKDEWRDTLKKSKLEFIKKAASFFNEIKKEKYDVVFDLSLNSQYGFFLRMSGIPKRLGFNFRNRGRFLTDKIDITYGYSDKHVARYHLELLKFLNITPKDYKFDLFVSSNSLQRVKEIFEKNNICEKDTLIAVCPGSGDSWRDTAYFKRWPQENFLKLCAKLSGGLKAKILLFGSKPEAGVCSYISSGLKNDVINLCGKIDLEEFCAAVSLCNLVITNDGGPFHIAQALGKKAIVLFGPVDEKVYGAYPVTDNCVIFSKHISCRPCYKSFRFSGCNLDKQCLREIGVDEVFLAAESLLKP